MKNLFGYLCLMVSAGVLASENDFCTKIGELKHCHSGEWQQVQSALDNGKTILRYRRGNDELNLFVSSESVNLREMLADDVSVTEESSKGVGDLNWEIVVGERAGKNMRVFPVLFKRNYQGSTYYGYASSQSENTSRELVTRFLSGFSTAVERSLTGPEFSGKKYYFGWGAAGSSDPSLMQNEVKYDVLHTHDIFTKDVGGNYIGTKYTDYKTATASNIKKTWSDIKAKITANDMYVQYSSGHGMPTGLGVGVSYDQIANQVLAFGAKETIIFTMACYSGGLVDSFNEKKDQWKDFQSKGKTLFVLVSSKDDETSSTGPGTDPEQPNSPEGSAGSAYGHALWKALIGHADGKDSGVKDGYLNIEEIRDFTVEKTQEVGGHTPVYTGSYDAKLIMNRVPSKAFLESLGVTSEGLSDEQVMERVREMDRVLRIN